MSIKEDALIVGGIAIAIIGVLWYAKNKIGDVADGVAAAFPYVNPADSRNVVNQGFEGLYKGVTGSQGTLGTDIYDLLHPTGGVVPYVNPADSRNIVNQGFGGLYKSVTGSQGTLGTDVYDFFHPAP